MGELFREKFMFRDIRGEEGKLRYRCTPCSTYKAFRRGVWCADFLKFKLAMLNVCVFCQKEKRWNIYSGMYVQDVWLALAHILSPCIDFFFIFD